MLKDYAQTAVENFCLRVQAMHSALWNVRRDMATTRATGAANAGLSLVNTGTWFQIPHQKTVQIINGRGKKILNG